MSRPYNTKGWRRIRRKVLERDDFTCIVCGRHKSVLPRGETSLTAAHIHAHRMGGTETMDNLVTVCAQCHGKADGGRRYQ